MTDDGAYMVSAGQDHRIRIWGAATGANTLANFGPTMRSDDNGHSIVFVSPVGLTPPKRQFFCYLNDNEILALHLHEVSVVSRLKGKPSTADISTE